MMQGNKIRISARELLDLLAGTLDQKRFAENHRMFGRGNIFKHYRSGGKMILKAEVESNQEEDDDWIVLEFSDGDPAMSKFKVPDSEGRQ
jgi:hypothetical protein